jgi:3-oxoadipate enol-lactonase
MSEPGPQRPSTDHEVAGASGTSLAASVQGDGAPVVLLHPLALSGGIWGEFAERLASQLRVVLPDTRGHGASTWDRTPFTVDELAEDVIRVADALELDTFNLVAMSMGGTTAISVAGRWPERVESLVLADTTAWYGADAPAVWEERAVSAVAVAREQQLGFQLTRWFTDDFAAAHGPVVDRAVDIFLQTDSEAHAAACRALGAADTRALLPRITARTLVLTGTEDYATPPAMGEAIAENVDGGWFLPVPGLRHLSLVEQPDLAGIVIAHIRQGARP